MEQNERLQANAADKNAQWVVGMMCEIDMMMMDARNNINRFALEILFNKTKQLWLRIEHLAPREDQDKINTHLENARDYLKEAFTSPANRRNHMSDTTIAEAAFAEVELVYSSIHGIPKFREWLWGVKGAQAI